MRFTKHAFFIFISLNVLLLTANSCKKYGQDIRKEILATVGPEVLTKEQARKNIPEFIYKQDSVEALVNYRKKWIDSQLINQEAQRLGLTTNNEVQQRIEKLKSDIYRIALKNAVFQNDTANVNVTPQEAKNYYELHKEQFLLQERYIRFRHLKTSSLEESRQAKRDLMQGVGWREVVEKYGLDKQETLSNSTKFWPISMALTDLEAMNRYLQIIGINEISPIRLLNGQYHFVQLVEQYEKGEHPNLDWLLDKIQEWLAIEKRRKLFSNYIRNLHLQAESNNEIVRFDVTVDSLQNSR